ncbi:hypothetical protein, partial [Intestinibacillus massiliensis]
LRLKRAPPVPNEARPCQAAPERAAAPKLCEIWFSQRFALVSKAREAPALLWKTADAVFCFMRLTAF